MSPWQRARRPEQKEIRRRAILDSAADLFMTREELKPYRLEFGPTLEQALRVLLRGILSEEEEASAR